jgi:hypothetical protein
MALTKATYSMIAGAAINVIDFGADPTGVTDSTAAIQAAIEHQEALAQVFARGAIQGVPLENYQVGTAPFVYFPKGKYNISNELTYYGYSKFVGEQSIIYQSDATKDIFTSNTINQNEFNNLQFVGGNRHIYAANGTNFEGVIVRVYDCNFEANASYNLFFDKVPSAGGEQAIVSGCRTLNGALTAYTEFDFCEFNNCWFEFRAITFPNDTAQFVNKGAMKIVDCCFVPGSDSLNSATDFRRYVDAYESVEIVRCRFGSEGGGGCPIVYSFINQLSNTSYPYQGSIIVIRDCEAVACGGSNRLDTGFIVAKSGLPQVIEIAGNGFSFDGPFINTSQFTGSISLATYLASYTNILSRIWTFNVSTNSKFGGTLTSNTTDDALLLPWTAYDKATTSLKEYYRDTQYNKKIYVNDLLQGRSVLQTSSTSGVAIFDTGIFYSQYSNASIWELQMTGNPNFAGSVPYTIPQTGTIAVGTTNVGTPPEQEIIYTAGVVPNFTGLTEFTITTVFWDGASETTNVPNGATNTQIRIKVSGYAAGFEGASTVLYLTRRL